MPYPDCLLPVAPNYTMIEAAVVEAAFAGCDTIWIVCNDDLAPVVRYKVGDYIQDPVSFYNNYEKFPSQHRKRVSIFWVPLHPKDRDKRDCLSWSVLHGAITALKVSDQISKWLIPDKYYVSFPYGIMDPRELRQVRSKIRSKENFFVSHNGKTVRDNNYSSFTFGRDEFVAYRRNIRKGTGVYTSETLNDHGIPSSKLPIEERWSARFFSPSDVFGSVEPKNAYMFQAKNFFNLNSWNSYREYISSDLCTGTIRPSKEMFSYKEFNHIAKDRN